MIITVTLNPTLDKTLSVPRLQPGTVHRARIVREDLGGKGINVSRALKALGITSKLTGFMGGKTGQILTSGLQAAGFDVHFVEIEDETRRNITLLDESSNRYTKINEPGPTVGPRHLAALQAQIDQMVQPGDLWAFCGSLPPGAPYDLYANLIQQVQGRGGHALLDTSGRALHKGLIARPFAIKPNSEEAAELLGDPLNSNEDHCAAARRLQSREVPVVALTRGAQGLVLATGEHVLMALAPAVSARSPVGAGDAALAGLLWAISDVCDPFETVRRIVACGTATAMQEGTGVGDRILVEHLLKQVQVVDC